VPRGWVSWVLPGLQQLLAQMRVDGGIGRAARRAGERDGRRAQPLAPDEQLGRRADEGGVAAARAVDEARTEAGAQHAEDRGRIVRRGRMDRNLAREHDLLEGT
jgi:hypothetical protein